MFRCRARWVSLTGTVAEAVRKPAVALLCAAQFVVVLDGTIVAVALPSIGRDLGFSATTLPWVISAFALVSAAS